MKKTVAILVMMSIGLWAEFIRSGNIVTDSVTGLEWQDDAVGNSMEWQEAITHCEGLSLDGYDDWRLPNKNELISIVDYSKYSPSINSQFQNTTSSNYYWSSTTDASSTDFAWGVYLYGDTNGGRKDFSYNVRCVRAGE